MSTLKQMEAFVAVVEQGSFTAAAMIFNVSPAAICKSVNALEKSLQKNLLIRTPRLLQTTEVGQKYYLQCKIILHEYHISQQILESDSLEPSGTLHILCQREIAQKTVFPGLSTFLQKYPKIITNVTVKNNLHDININHFDFAIGYHPTDLFNDWLS